MVLFHQKNSLLTFLFISITSVVFGQSTLPVANFQLSANKGCVPLTISITNLSSNASQYDWNFGNGTTSKAVNPSVVYPSKGIFTIQLIAKDSLNNADTLIISDAVKVNDLPTANFTSSLNSNCLSEHELSLTSHSIGGAFYAWDFGDGNSSTLEHPKHKYSDSGNYHVKLLVSDSIGCSSLFQAPQSVNIVKAVAAEFTVNDTSSCDSSFNFLFNHTSSNTVSWNWNFGDGDSSSLPNPNHNYNNSGLFDVKLSTLDINGCADTVSKLNYISIHPMQEIDFYSNFQSGCTPLEVGFFGDSIDVNTQLKWDFGNGHSILGDSMSEVYTNPGSYQVTLTSIDQNGCRDTLTKANYIKVNPNGITASFSFDTLSLCSNNLIQFTNSSQGGAYYEWDFGDSSTSILENPLHSYNKSGNYNITLLVSDSLGCSMTISKQIQIQNLQADFNSPKTVGCSPLQVEFHDVSVNASKWFWKFGDGDTSHQQNPLHIYQTSGNYDVTLIVETSNGCLDSLKHLNFVQVSNDTIAESIGDTIIGCLPLPIDFSENKIGTNQWLWDFGNGHTDTSKAPSYTYLSPGTFTVSLSTFSSNGCPIFIKNYTTIKIDSVTPKINYLYFNCADTTIQFTDSTKDAISWLWDFGDGTYSTLQNPVHKFPDTLLYNIRLTIITINGCTYSVFFPNYVDFSDCLVNGKGTSNSAGSPPPISSPDTLNSSNIRPNNCAPQIVRFYNPDSTALSWNWDFGDGNTSSLENPTHIYQIPGVFNVLLIVHKPTGLDTIFWNNPITVDGPIADYTSLTVNECDSAFVQFNSTSQNVLEWDWKITKTVNSRLENPSHKFPFSNKNYPILLSGKDSSGCLSSKIRVFNFPQNRISFNYQDSICFGDTMFFSASDTSATYVWDFGDGTLDSTKFPFHIYKNPGNYAVQVISKTSLGCIEMHMLNPIKVKGLGATFQIIDSIKCKNEIFSFVPKDLTGESYIWNIGNKWSDTSKVLHRKFDLSGKYEVSLTINKDGCSNTYKHDSLIEVKNIDVDFTFQQLNNCYPIQIHVSDTNSNSLNWEWSFNDSLYHGNNSFIFAIKDSSALVSLNIKTKNGCRDSISKIFEPDFLKSEFETKDTLGCAPFLASFTNHSSNYDSLIWYFGDGDSSMQVNPNHQYKKPGIYTVSLIALSADGCADTSIYLNAIKVSEIKANYSNNFNSTCAPMIVNFMDSSSSSVSWKWNFGDGTSSRNKNPMHIYNNSGIYDVSLIVSNSYGCTDTLVTKNQIVVPGPITKFTVADTVVCGIKPVQFSDSSTNAIEWNWFFGDGNTSTMQNPTHTYSTKGEFEVSLLTRDSSGCRGYYKMPTKIKMDLSPSANFSLSDSAGCTPFEVKINNLSSNVSKWSWNMGDGVSTKDTLSTYTYNKPGSYSISLRIENEVGCTDSMQIDSVVAFYAPSSKFNTVDKICENEASIVITAESYGGIWSGKGIIDSLIGTYSPSAAGVGKDTVKYVINGSCPSTDSMIINVLSAPKANFITDNNEGCNKLEVKLENVLEENISDKSGYTYLWKANGIVFGNQSAIKKTFSTGIYNISLSINDLKNGCSDEVSRPSLIKVFDSKPSKTNLKRVSVNSDSEVFVEWENNNDIAFDHYILYRKSPLDSSFIEIFRTDSSTKVNFIDKGLNTLDNIYCYKIISVDKCNQMYPLDEVPFHCTINVTTSKKSYDKVEVKWNRYLGCNVESYEIMRLEDESNTSKVIAKVNSSQLKFTDTSAYCNHTYTYRVKALGQAGLTLGSFSDTAVTKININSKFQESKIKRATVNDGSVLIEWTPIDNAPKFITGFILHRSLDNHFYTPLTFIPLTDTSYTDQTALINKNQYFYKIETVNTCNNENELSNTGSSILLESSQTDDQSGKLGWTTYEKWKTGVKAYEIQHLNEFNVWETIKILPENTLEHTINF